MAIENIRVDNERTVAINDGRVLVLENNTVTSVNPLGAKALIAAVYEIEELRTRLESLPGRTIAAAADPTALLNEPVEGGKYTIVSTIWGVSLLRQGQVWIDEDGLDLPELWDSVGHELRELRAWIARLQARDLIAERRRLRSRGGAGSPT